MRGEFGYLRFFFFTQIYWYITSQGKRVLQNQFFTGFASISQTDDQKSSWKQKWIEIVHQLFLIIFSTRDRRNWRRTEGSNVKFFYELRSAGTLLQIKHQTLNTDRLTIEDSAFLYHEKIIRFSINISLFSVS